MKTFKNITSERAIGNWLKRWCEERKYRIVKLNPAQYNGLPDRLIMTDNGRCIFIEIKSKGCSLRPMQVHWLDWLKGNGHQTLVLDEVNESTSYYLGEMIKHKYV